MMSLYLSDAFVYVTHSRLDDPRGDVYLQIIWFQINDLISKFQIGLNFLLRQGLSEPEFYVDLVYTLKKILALIIFQCSSLK